MSDRPTPEEQLRRCHESATRLAEKLHVAQTSSQRLEEALRRIERLLNIGEFADDEAWVACGKEAHKIALASLSLGLPDEEGEELPVPMPFATRVELVAGGIEGRAASGKPYSLEEMSALAGRLRELLGASVRDVTGEGER